MNESEKKSKLLPNVNAEFFFIQKTSTACDKIPPKT